MTVLLVCSGGGHLKQLHQLVPRLGLGDRPRLWVTFDGGLSRGLLAGEEVLHARHAVPRDVKNIALNAAHGLRALRGRGIDLAISTGASPAVSYLTATALRGVPTHYIESATRVAGPSLTGRIMHRVPRVHTYTQYESWARDGWRYGGSVFDAYRPEPEARTTARIARAVVSLGTAETLGFRRLVEALVPLLDGCEVLWQTGATDVSGLPVEGRDRVPYDELSAAIAEADVVVSHAGTGAALTAFEHGRMPVLVPRRARHGEHVDDHQLQTAAEMSRRGLAVSREVAELDAAALVSAAAGAVRRVPELPPFHLA